MAFPAQGVRDNGVNRFELSFKLLWGFMLFQTSSWRPSHATSAEDVCMNIFNGLLTIASVIKHNAIAIRFETELFRYMRDFCHILPDRFGIRAREIRETHPAFLRYDEHVYGSLRGDVVKG